MGLTKSIKKAVKKVTKVVSNVIPGGGAVNKLLGDDEKPQAAAVEAPVVNTPAPTPAAAVVEAPKEDSYGDEDADTEAAKKAARAKGKKGLSVARSNGTGLNI